MPCILYMYEHNKDSDGSNKDDFLPDLEVDGQFDYNLLIAANLATASGMPVANLYQIPNAVNTRQ